MATKKSVTAYDDRGRAVLGLNLGKTPEVKDISVDAGSGDLWVALKKTLRRYHASGVMLFELGIDKLERLASDGQGDVWAATNKDLLRLDEAGRVLFKLQPFGGKETIVALVADPADLSVWVANQKALSHLSAEGRLLHRLDFHDSKDELRFEGNIRDLALYADLIPPVIAFMAPENGSLLNTNSPNLAVNYTDIGIGVDTASLHLQADGRDLAVECTVGDTLATCTPATPFSEGRITLTATIADLAGNASEPAQVRFTVDTIAPAITLETPRDGTLTNQPQQTFVGQLSEAASLTLNGQPVSVGQDRTFSHGPLTLVEGANIFGFIATDAAGNVGQLTVQVTLDTVPPAAVSPDQIAVGQVTNGQVSISGTAGSVEPNATVEVTNTRTGTTVTVLANIDGRFMATIAAQRGDVLSIVVTDSAGNDSPASTVIVNAPVVAHAGDEANAVTARPIALDGSASHDPDGDLLTFRWTPVQAPQGSTATLSDPLVPNPQLIPDVPGEYVFALVVHDGLAESPPASVAVRALSGNAPPNARAGRDRTALVGTAVSLDGRASHDPNQDALSFRWSLTSIPAGSALTDAAIAGRESPTPQFVPDVPGIYVLTLRVSDGSLTDEDTVQVFADTPNVGPYADAGRDLVKTGSEEVTLDGRGSVDLDGGPTLLHFS